MHPSSLLLVLLALPAAASAQTLDVLKLKETPTGNYAVVVRTTTALGVDADLDVQVTDLDTCATIALSPPQRNRYLSLGENTLSMGPTFSFAPGDGTYPLAGTIAYEDGAAEAFAIDVPGCAEGARCDWGDTTLSDGTTLRMRTTRASGGDPAQSAASPTLAMQIRPGDPNTPLRAVAALDVWDAAIDPTDPGNASRIAGVRNLDLIRARHRQVVDVASLGGSSFNVAAQLSAPDGTVLDSWTDYVSLGTTEDLRLYDARLKPRNDGSKLVLRTEALGDAAPATAEVVISNPADPTQRFADASRDSSGTAYRTYRLGAIHHSTPAFSVNTYNVTITATLPDRSVAFSTDVVFDAAQVLVADGVSAPDESRLALHKVGTYPQPDGNAELAFSFEGRDADLIEAVEVQFNEPFEGDAPAETVATAELESTVERWVVPFAGYGGGDPAGSDDGLYDISVTFRDDEGQVIDQSSFTIQAQFGSGTRGSASAASSRTELL